MPDSASPTIIRVEDCPKRIRVLLGGVAVVDTLKAKLLFEGRYFPVFYFPLDAIDPALLSRTDRTTHCPHKGDASYWTLSAGGEVRENAVWGYETPKPGVEAIAGHVAFYWDKVDAWLEEDQPLLGHARDPYHRVDTLPSSRRVVVRLGGQVIADSTRAVFLYETNFPARYYIPPQDVRLDLLGPSDSSTLCPYKGRAGYYSAAKPDGTRQDVAWYYPEPLSETLIIKDLIAFYPDRVDSIEVADR